MADVHQQDTTAITAAIAAADTATEKEDAQAANAALAEDYVSYDAKGKQTVKSKADAIAQATKMFTIATGFTSKSVPTKIVYDKTGAAVYETENGTFTMSAHDQQHVMSVHGTYRNYWIKSKGIWLEKQSRALTEVYAIDGKPVPAE
jgi:ketosteroid isomerase-like protein